MQTTLVSPNSPILATTAEISLQHTHSALVGMIEQWPHKHLQVSVTDFMTGQKACHHHYHQSDPRLTRYHWAQTVMEVISPQNHSLNQYHSLCIRHSPKLIYLASFLSVICVINKPRLLIRLWFMFTMSSCNSPSV